ncbi:putative transcriptional regulatory protein [Vanrija pseudolonga]|uniref:Purtative transcriptional regulatory protein n=1 Tax=Vanrija pseudolonga TaxID=143232 RepID=A0AAF0Y3Q4_9TREE|nr:purtative transcriptional regulatory protein [Vanrija pseudolonga]
MYGFGNTYQSDSSSGSSPDITGLLPPRHQWPQQQQQQQQQQQLSQLQANAYAGQPAQSPLGGASSGGASPCGSASLADWAVQHEFDRHGGLPTPPPSSSTLGDTKDGRPAPDDLHRLYAYTGAVRQPSPPQGRHHPYLVSSAGASAAESSASAAHRRAIGAGADALNAISADQQLDALQQQQQPVKSGRLGVKRRQKYTRSRTGCLGCRARRIKCDEGRPICRRCQVAKRECCFPDPTDGKKGKGKGQTESDEDEDADQFAGGAETDGAQLDLPFDISSAITDGLGIDGAPVGWDRAFTGEGFSSVGASLDAVLASAAGHAENGKNNLLAPPLLNTPNFLLPWFPTPQEQSLILHYCANAADLMIAIPQGINPLLAINLPLALAAPRGTNLAADALRITLLGIGAVHQAFLLARSGVSTTQTTATFQYASNLRDMGKELVRRATLPEGGGIASDAALSAGTSLATIDIFFGGSGWQENFALAKRMVAARGGPARMLKDSTPTHLSDGVTATPSRLILEILAIYETFGCLTMGEEPELISDRDSWWFESSGSTFEEHSVETQFGMSRVMVHLFSRTARLLARAAKTGTGFLPEGSPTNKLSADSVLHVDSSGSGLLPASVMPYVYVPSEDSNEPAGLASEAARLSRDIDMWIESLAFSSVEHERVQVGNRAYAHAMKILLLRMVYGRSRDDSSVQAAAQEVLQHCSISTAALGMSIDLMWPAVIAGCCVQGSARQWLLTLLEGFKSQCCFDVDTASRIIQEVWRRVDAGEPRADWKPVCDDFGLQVLLC